MASLVVDGSIRFVRLTDDLKWGLNGRLLNLAHNVNEELMNNSVLHMFGCSQPGSHFVTKNMKIRTIQ